MLKTKQQFAVLILGVFLFVGAILPVAAFAQDCKDSPFGFHYANKLPECAPDLGIAWVRVNAVWDVIQSETDIINGNYNWAAFEKHDYTPPPGREHILYVRLNSYPKNTNFLITLICTFGTAIADSDSYVLDEGPYAKENWIKYTKAVVNRYKDRIKYWQVENEPKYKKKNFAELQKITYNAIKEECPECQVIMGGVFWGGLTDRWDRLNQRFLLELNGNYVDIFDQHYYGGADEYNPQTLLDHAKQRLAEANFIETPIWITEIGDYSGDPKEVIGINDPPYQSEQVQAQSLLKRFVSSLSYGVEKIFWFGLFEGFHYEEIYPDFIGLIYDGVYEHDLGYGVKKLAYYTYKLMTEKLEGSNWDSITTVIDSIDNKYAYKFINDSTGKPTYVTWWDYFNDPTYTIGDSSLITLTGISSNQVIVTNAVPTETSGIYITDYNTAFSIDTLNVSGGSISFYLKESPVFIEEISNTSIEETGSITPNKFQLNQNYPNPFNPKTVISFQLSVFSNITLKIYDTLGQEVRTLVNENKSAGYHSVVWNGRNEFGERVSSGIYFYSLELDNLSACGHAQADNFSLYKKLLLLK